jgi:signal transduction histidine kinase
LEQQLRLADRLATIGTLAAGTAHELNEPLGAVLGFAQLASKSPGLPESAARDLDRIAKAALHAREVIKQLMLFARQTPPNKSAVDLRQVVEEALVFLAGRCQEAGITVSRRLEPVPGIVADANQLRQVVLNLTVNALQATAKGGEVRVSLTTVGRAVRLIVEDDGVGMTEEIREKIFLPFYTTKETGQGTGLGLSVVHGIVASHGGEIRVESSPGRGTRFEVDLRSTGS